MAIKILIVDDEEGIRNSVASYLTLEGYEVAKASGGGEAVDMIRHKKYNIVLLDINMPMMDGLETLKEIKTIDFSIQVIMMTAYSTFEKTMTSLEYGANDYILKPFEELKDILYLVEISAERLERWKRSMSSSIQKQREGG